MTDGAETSYPNWIMAQPKLQIYKHLNLGVICYAATEDQNIYYITTSIFMCVWKFLY